MAYPDLSFLSVFKNGARAIVIRSLLLLVAIVLFAQGINGYFFSSLTGAERVADIILTLKITLIVAAPFVFYVVILHARADLAIEYFRTLSRTDSLTGLLNRRAFLDLLKGKYGREGRQSDNNDALLVMDLDHFKQVNDRFGHEAGDAILQQVADLFRCNLRSEDIIARFGGEEFAVALNRATPRETCMVAQRLRQAVESNVFMYDDQQVRVTISIGLVRYMKGQKLENALRQADLLTYQSKKDGRNRISYADEQFNMPTAA
ncbi:MAG: GGDEF domain-containing protein [Hyphomicrobiales bacterium]|nr:GGDEF domain-containing protein [Hyphomicrobiales bacterium]MCP4997399.1 GGDEF domain-containing protein [Hyphomicrobiales bacterium]